MHIYMLCNSIDHMPAIYKMITKTLYTSTNFVVITL